MNSIHTMNTIPNISIEDEEIEDNIAGEEEDENKEE